MKLIKRSHSALYTLLFFVITHIAFAQNKAEQLSQQLRDADDDHIFVVAHRGDWRHAPENSLQAIQNCIDMGVEMVEIDVRKTKDSVFILMHDDTIDRTTNGSGGVENMTWSELKVLKLTDPLKAVTNHRIPTLEEVLRVSERKILLNLDKVYDHIDPITEYLKSEDLLHQVVFKGWMKTYDDFVRDFNIPIDSIHFMPIVSLDEANWREVIESYSTKNNPVAFEILFKEEGDHEEAITLIQNLNSRVWINSLWAIFNAGHDDERAVNDPDGSYGWLISQGASIIQTDRPKLLLDYIKAKELNTAK